VATTAFTIDPSTKIITFSSAPANGTVIKVYRNTNNDTLAATFISGSAIRAVDLNDNFTQNLYVIQEIGNNAVQTDGSNPMVGDLNMGGYKIINLQSNPTADTDAANKHYVDTKVGASGPPGYTNWSYTATGGETVVGTFGSLLEYQVGKEQVYLNGALQQRNVDYTANDGNTVTFTVALTAADIVMVRCVNYLAADPTASYSFTRWRKTYNTLPTPATLIAGNSDAPEVALNYTINREQVFINGALLQRGVDYTPNNATSITLLSGPLITGDVVEVHSNNSI
jgi:predicted secreted protein